MKSQVSSQLQPHDQLQCSTLLKTLRQELHFPLHINQQIIHVLKEHQYLQKKYHKQEKMNALKDQVLQNVVVIFQAKQSKILNRLKKLEEINVKYMQRYLEAKKKSTKSRSDLNISLQMNSVEKTRKNDSHQISLNHQQRSINSKGKEDSFQISMVQMTESIFDSPEWTEMIQNSQNKLLQIENDQTQVQKPEDKQNQSLTLAKVLLKCIEQYCFAMDPITSQRKSLYVKQVQELIEAKKVEIDQNTSLKMNVQLSNDLKRLKNLLQMVLTFNAKIRQLRRAIDSSHTTNYRQIVLSVLEEKVEIQNLIEAEMCSAYSSAQQQNSLESSDKRQKRQKFKQNQQQAFSQLCNQLINCLQSQNESHFLAQLTKQIQQKSTRFESSVQSSLKSLEQYVSQIEKEAISDKQQISALGYKNQQISNNLKQLQIMKDKYEFYLNELQTLKSGSLLNNSLGNQSLPSKVTQKLDEMISKQQHEEQKELLRQCLAKKDELLELQQQQITSAKQDLSVVMFRINSYFEQHNIPLTSELDKVNLEQLFEIYSQSLSKTTFQRQPQEKQKLTKQLQTKYQKIVQSQRQQFQQRIQGLKQQLRHTELQRDSYKTSLASQQKQFTKLKQFTEKFIVKKADLEMQNFKTQEILKNILDIIFSYLMTNTNYETFLEQLEGVIESVKNGLKYREKEKEKESKDPLIDYRFSGLSAVSNDYSFSKLNKQSYCDYFNEDSEIEQESQVISKISSQDEVLPPSRPSFSTNLGPKRQLGLIDINQRATMAHQDQSLLGYLSPTPIRTPRAEFQRNNTVLLESGLHDENIRALQSKLGYLKNRISQQAVQVERQDAQDAKEMYIKYKQALKCLEEAQKINQDNEMKYQSFMKELKEEGVFEAKQKTENKLFYMDQIIKEQEQLIEQQRIEFQTTIAKKVVESEEAMNLLMRNLNKSMSASRVSRVGK